MQKRDTYKILFCLMLFITAGCKEQYIPPVMHLPGGYLVVEGVVLAGDDTTIIKLSHTVNIGDTAHPRPELGAAVTVTSETNDNYTLTDIGNGNYMAPGLPIDFTKKYKLTINTTDGRKYESDFVQAKKTQPIDSVGWYRDTGNNAFIHVSTHDPTNSTWYYRWNYTETWEYTSAVPSLIDWINHQIVYHPIDDGVYFCWLTDSSNDIHLFSTKKLSQDVAYKVPIAIVNSASEKLKFTYSILVRQYALTKDAYDFWQATKNNNEQLGTLFDPLPAQLPGNIHCITNPTEIVVGFLSVSSTTSKRIFLKRDDFIQGYYEPYYLAYQCETRLVFTDSLDYYLPATGHRDWVMIGKPIFGPGYYVMTANCADCREHGGTRVKPPYWP